MVEMEPLYSRLTSQRYDETVATSGIVEHTTGADSVLVEFDHQLLELCIRNFSRTFPKLSYLHQSNIRASEYSGRLLAVAAVGGFLHAADTVRKHASKIFEVTWLAVTQDLSDESLLRSELVVNVIQAALLLQGITLSVAKLPSFVENLKLHSLVVSCAKEAGVLQDVTNACRQRIIDAGTEHMAWKEFIPQEERLRVVNAIHAFDAQLSIIHGVDPLLDHKISSILRPSSDILFECQNYDEYCQTVRAQQTPQQSYWTVYTRLLTLIATIEQARKAKRLSANSIRRFELRLAEIYDAILQSSSSHGDISSTLRILWHSAFISLFTSSSELMLMLERTPPVDDGDASYLSTWGSSGVGLRTVSHSLAIGRLIEQQVLTPSSVLILCRSFRQAAMVIFAFVKYGSLSFDGQDGILGCDAQAPELCQAGTNIPKLLQSLEICTSTGRPISAHYNPALHSMLKTMDQLEGISLEGTLAARIRLAISKQVRKPLHQHVLVADAMTKDPHIPVLHTNGIDRSLSDVSKYEMASGGIACNNEPCRRCSAQGLVCIPTPDSRACVECRMAHRLCGAQIESAVKSMAVDKHAIALGPDRERGVGQARNVQAEDLPRIKRRRTSSGSLDRIQFPSCTFCVKAGVLCHPYYGKRCTRCHDEGLSCTKYQRANFDPNVLPSGYEKTQKIGTLCRRCLTLSLACHRSFGHDLPCDHCWASNNYCYSNTKGVVQQSKQPQQEEHLSLCVKDFGAASDQNEDRDELHDIIILGLTKSAPCRGSVRKSRGEPCGNSAPAAQGIGSSKDDSQLDDDDIATNADPLIVWADWLPKNPTKPNPEPRPRRRCFYEGHFCYKSGGPALPCDTCAKYGTCNPDLSGIVPWRYKKAQERQVKKAVTKSERSLPKTTSNTNAVYAPHFVNLDVSLGSPLPSVWNTAGTAARKDDDPLDNTTSDQQMSELANMYTEPSPQSFVDLDVANGDAEHWSSTSSEDEIAEQDTGLRLLHFYMQNPPGSTTTSTDEFVRAVPCRRCLWERRACIFKNNLKDNVCRNCRTAQRNCNSNLLGVKPYVHRWRHHADEFFASKTVQYPENRQTLASLDERVSAHRVMGQALNGNTSTSTGPQTESVNVSHTFVDKQKPFIGSDLLLPGNDRKHPT